MTTTQFKTLGNVLKQYRIRYSEKKFKIIKQAKVPKLLSMDLVFMVKTLLTMF